jgi:NADH-quinone oxidoreductase subunit K
MGLQAYLLLAAALFAIGLFGVMTRRNTIGTVDGMVFTVFTICITVVEVALGLAIVILIFRVRRTVVADHLDLLRG